MMKIRVNEKNEITAYATVGGLPDSIEYTGGIPDDFETDFKPGGYLCENASIKINPDYVEPATDEPVDTPSHVNKSIAQLALQTAQQKAQQDKLNAQVLLEIAQLKGGSN